MPHVDNSQITPLYANTTPGLTADPNVIDPAIAAIIAASNENYDEFLAFKASIELPIPDQSIVTRHLRNLAVTNPKLAPLAVTADKIANGAITLEKLADLMITAAKIADGTITEPKYADRSVSSRAIALNSVNSQHIDPALFQSLSDIAIQSEIEKRTGVSIQKFGAKIDGNTVDNAAIQQVINYCITNNLNLNGVSGDCVITSTIFIPKNPVFKRKIKLDLKGVNFIVPDGVTLFESGKLVGSSWVSTFSDPNDSNNSFGVTLCNFTVQGGFCAMKIADWHQSCVIKDITTTGCNTALWARNCYYMDVDSVNSSKDETLPYTGSRFIFDGQSNLMEIRNCSAINSDIGYQIAQCTAFTLFKCSIEGCNTGVKFTSEVYDVKINGCYVENIKTRAFDFTNYVHSAHFTNNYINFLNQNWYLIKHVSLFASNIVFDKSNRIEAIPSNIYLFENKDLGYITFQEHPKVSFSISDLDVSNSNYPQSSVYERKVTLGTDGPVANVVKNYAVGNYSGRMTPGFLNSLLFGMEVITKVGTFVSLQTRIKYSATQILYIAFSCIDNNENFVAKGFFIGNVFYEFTSTGIAVTTNLTMITSGSYIVIKTKTLDNGGNPSFEFQAVEGEIRVL